MSCYSEKAEHNKPNHIKAPASFYRTYLLLRPLPLLLLFIIILLIYYCYVFNYPTQLNVSTRPAWQDKTPTINHTITLSIAVTIFKGLVPLIWYSATGCWRIMRN
uniref:ABC transporter permease n=1 Tax=Heterorhabditis bacteriophora TaxID=37862 RepID=A0A1I7WFK6_HETBA